MLMYQFVCKKQCVKIPLIQRDIKILAKHGWEFFCMECNLPDNFNPTDACTCVQLTKCAVGIKKIYIQTPYALYKYLIKSQ